MPGRGSGASSASQYMRAAGAAVFASQYSVMLSRMWSRDVVAAERPAGLGDLEDVQQLLDAVRVVRRALEVEDPAVHLLAAARAGSGEDD
jgi:hypothetical protein